MSHGQIKGKQHKAPMLQSTFKITGIFLPILYIFDKQTSSFHSHVSLDYASKLSLDSN